MDPYEEMLRAQSFRGYRPLGTEHIVPERVRDPATGREIMYYSHEKEAYRQRALAAEQALRNAQKEHQKVNTLDDVRPIKNVKLLLI